MFFACVFQWGTVALGAYLGWTLFVSHPLIGAILCAMVGFFAGTIPYGLATGRMTHFAVVRFLLWIGALIAGAIAGWSIYSAHPLIGGLLGTFVGLAGGSLLSLWLTAWRLRILGKAMGNSH